VNELGLAVIYPNVRGSSGYGKTYVRLDNAMRVFFEQINSTSNADRIRSALMVAHGVNDPRAPFGEAKQIADKAGSSAQSGAGVSR